MRISLVNQDMTRADILIVKVTGAEQATVLIEATDGETGTSSLVTLTRDQGRELYEFLDSVYGK